MSKTITIEAAVKGDIAKVWKMWNAPEDIQEWMHASADWECTKAVNDLRVGGKFCYTLGAKDKSVAFDLPGTYTQVDEDKFIGSTLADDRKVAVTFSVDGTDAVRMVQAFEMENENSEELQRAGWQAMLDSFKAYVENN